MTEKPVALPSQQPTTGPYHVAGERGEFVNDPHEMNICRVNPTVSWAGVKSVSDGPRSHEANANLLAASWSLQEALLGMLELERHTHRLPDTINAEFVHRVIGDAKAALRKAKGETL